MIWFLMSIFWLVISIVGWVLNFWSYANSIETAVLLVIIIDVVWHRVSAHRDIKRDEEAEKRTIQREEAFEKRQVRRERQEFIRKHWQELQHGLISLHRVTTHLVQQMRFIRENKDSQDDTTRQAMMMTINNLPEQLAEFDDRWGRIVSQLNVFPQPRDALTIEVSTIVLALGETVRNKNTEIKDETLKALAKLVSKAADKGTFSNLDD
jgi:thioesterase domain-containing protein